ncbi:putative Peptidase family C78 [Paratrimastix pyriformis]|uniref:Peptidase family C78 n=1 Tax=Paratrimastix pyriformis TaxID=342808 RepID=A0ABQ8UGD0_9EUKA|nr:putative Peptidase family C78 [Paratrimastix pyriformis]
MSQAERGWKSGGHTTGGAPAKKMASRPDPRHRAPPPPPLQDDTMPDLETCSFSLVPVIAHCFRTGNIRGVKRVILCNDFDHYTSGDRDTGFGCGYRNIQLLGSALLRRPAFLRPLFGGAGFVPGIVRIQHLIEQAWQRGFDEYGCRQFKGKLVGKRDWIGTSECATLFLSWGIPLSVVNFTTGLDPLCRFASEYFGRHAAIFQPAPEPPLPASSTTPAHITPCTAASLRGGSGRPGSSSASGNPPPHSNKKKRVSVADLLGIRRPAAPPAATTPTDPIIIPSDDDGPPSAHIPRRRRCVRDGEEDGVRVLEREDSLGGPMSGLAVQGRSPVMDQIGDSPELGDAPIGGCSSVSEALAVWPPPPPPPDPASVLPVHDPSAASVPLPCATGSPVAASYLQPCLVECPACGGRQRAGPCDPPAMVERTRTGIELIQMQGCFCPPVYLQHQGHSRTLVGIEERTDGRIVLLIVDPAEHYGKMCRFDGRMLYTIRFPTEKLKHIPKFQMCLVPTERLLTSVEREKAKVLKCSAL